jgi:hypothetical protein
MTRWKPPLKAKRDASEAAIFDTLRAYGALQLQSSYAKVDRAGTRYQRSPGP